MATATTSGSAGRLPAPPPQTDWPAQAADTIERVVATVRDKTTAPALTIARGVVYGTFALLVGTACLVVFVIGAIRALDVALPDSIFGAQHVWAAYLILGLAFLIPGAVLWGKRNDPREEQPAH